MGIEVEKMIAVLEARIDKFEKNLAKASGTADRQFTKIENRGAAMTKRLESSFGTNFLKGAATGALGALLAGFNVSALRDAVKGLGDLADLSGKIGIAADRIQALRYAAEQSGGSIEAVDTGLVRFVKNVSDAGRGTGDLYNVLKANGVALQDQAGNLRSSTDLFGVYADLVANAKNPQDQLNLAVMAFGKAAGPDLVGLLKQGSAGVDELTAKAQTAGRVLGNDVVAEADALDDKMAELEGRLSTTFGEFAVKTGPLLIQGLTSINELVADIAATLNSWPTQKLDDLVNWAQNQMANSGRAFGEATGLRQAGTETFRALGLPAPAVQQQDAAYADFESRRARAMSSLGDAPAKAAANSATATIVPKAGSSASDRANEYDRLVKSIKDRTQAVVAETNAQAGLNPLVNDYGFAVEKARAEQDLLNAAIAAGINITPELRKQIDELSTGYAAVSVDAAKLAEQQDRVREAAAEFSSAGRDLFGGIISDLREGKTAAEAFSGVLDKLIDRVVDLGLNAAFGGGGGSGGGLVGSLISSVLGGAGGGAKGIGHRARGGSVTAGQPYIVGEKRPELFVPGRSGTIVPNLIPKSVNARQAPPVVNVKIDAPPGTMVAEQSQQSNSAGGYDVLVKMVDDRIQQQIGTGNADAALRGRFGLRQGKTR